MNCYVFVDIINNIQPILPFYIYICFTCIFASCYVTKFHTIPSDFLVSVEILKSQYLHTIIMMYSLFYLENFTIYSQQFMCISNKALRRYWKLVYFSFSQGISAVSGTTLLG